MKIKAKKKDVKNILKTTPEERDKLRNRWYQRRFQLERKLTVLQGGGTLGEKSYTTEQIEAELKTVNNLIKMKRGKGPGRPTKTKVVTA